MSKLKIEHGVSKTERVKLQVSIDQAVANDIELMAEWSNNEKNYIVNELLRFALGESAGFQQHKQSLTAPSQPDPQAYETVVTNGAAAAAKSTSPAAGPAR